MKLLFGVLFIIYFMAIINAEEEEEMTDNQKMMLSFAEDCIAETNPNKDDLKIFVKMGLPNTREGKCLSGCLMKQFQIIADGKYISQALIGGMKAILPKDDKRLPILEEIATECESVTDEDVCELAYKVSSCLEEKAVAKGIEKD